MTLPETAANFLLSKGLSRDAAVAVTSVLYYESKLNPGPQGAQSSETPGVLNPKGAYGIASWNGPRQQGLADFAVKLSLPVENLETQLHFVLNEAANHYPKTWAAITGPGAYQDIIPVFVAEYENPKDHEKEINGALGHAEALYPKVGTQPPAAQPAPPAPPAPTPPVPVVQAVDEEIATIQKAYTILAGLSPLVQRRVLAYLDSRFNQPT